MNKEAVFHEADSSYSFPISKDEITLRLRVANKDKFSKVRVIYGNKYDYYQVQKYAEMSLKYQTAIYNFYEVTIKLEDVRFVYIFELTHKGKIYYFCEDGIVTNYDYNFAYFNCFQYPFINEIDIVKRIDWLKDRVFYQIFIDRFNCGNDAKDKGYIDLGRDDIPNPKSFYGGDLKGIISKLDYLHSLGINALYLTPIFKSISNHKYDISDYYTIDEMFGSKEDLKELITKAHALGIKVLLDAVFNHCSDQMAQFQDVLKHGKKSKYFDWFIIKDDKVDQEKMNYEVFSICNYLPKLNTSNPEVRQYLIAIGKYYLEEFAIDGWRLDVADEVSHRFWQEFRLEVKKVKPDCFLVAENWHNSYPFLRGNEVDSIMNYAFTKTMLDYIAFQKIDALGASYQLNSLLLRNIDQTNDMMLNLLDTHDTDRFYTSCNKNIDKLLLGLATLFIFKGIPGIYYGVEIPLEGGYDPDNRRPMNFEKIATEGQYFQTLKKLIELRKTSDELCFGDIDVYAQDDILVIKRTKAGKKLYLYVNNTSKAKKIIAPEVLVSHNYDNNVLLPQGFVIIREEK